MTSAKNKQAKRKVNKSEHNVDLLLACAFLFLGTNQLNLDQVFSCELALVPTHYFGNQGVQDTQKISLCS